MKAEHGSIRINGTAPSINVNIYGLAPPETGHPAESPLTPSMRKTDWSRRTGKPGRRTW
ncbi:MAG: hypothetical protein ACLT38_06740 [Akkermansia sp.]